MKPYLAGVATLIILGACSPGKINQKQFKTEKMTKKEVAAAINNAVQNGDVEKAASLVWPEYIQHTAVVPDGQEGLKTLVGKIKNKEIPAPQISNVRAFEDEDFVILHHDVMWGTKKVMFEIFRFEGDLAIEHWSGLADQPESTANGHSMVDGETRVTDLDKTKENKALVKSFVENVLIGGQFDKIADYYDENIIQHNPYIDNTIEGLIKGVQSLEEQGITLQIDKIHYVLGQGNFVLTLSEGKFGGKPTAFFDLFRVANGKVVEHWDVLQKIPETMPHTNGMF